jgi:hypothetical protein
MVIQHDDSRDRAQGALCSALGDITMPRWGNAVEGLLNEFRWFECSPRYRCLGEISNLRILDAVPHVEDST